MSKKIGKENIIIFLSSLLVTVILIHAQTYYKTSSDIDLDPYGNLVKATVRGYYDDGIPYYCYEKAIGECYLSSSPGFSSASDLYVSLHIDSGIYTTHSNAELGQAIWIEKSLPSHVVGAEAWRRLYDAIEDTYFTLHAYVGLKRGG